jgi:putative ABC transport system substrate-binding protein
VNDRRAFILAVTGGLLAAPLVAEAQRAREKPRIGIVVPVEPASPTEPNVAAFRQEMRSLGYVEGQNIAIEYRYAHGRDELYPQLAADLIRLKVDVMVVGSWQPALAAKNLTQTIPIVGIGMGADPVRLGVVASLNRPGGNVTGSAWLTGKEVGGKWVELLKQAAPRIVRVGYLTDSRIPANQSLTLEAAQAAADMQRVALQVFQARALDEVETIFTQVGKDRGSGLIVQSALLFSANASDIAKLAAKYRVPAIYSMRVFMDAGGLMSYGPTLSDLWSRAAIHVDKILKGARPADIPVERPTKFELLINLQTAKTLGLTIPQSLLLRADQVIE